MGKFCANFGFDQCCNFIGIFPFLMQLAAGQPIQSSGAFNCESHQDCGSF